jgi:DNA modification methylase
LPVQNGRSRPAVSPAAASLRDRVIELRRVHTDELADNESNWRTHPNAQREALRGILEAIGIAGALLAYHSERQGGRLTLIDGHLRRSEAPGEWPVLVLDLTDEEADLLLATLDPIAGLAAADREKLAALLDRTATASQNAAVQQLLAQIAKQAGISDRQQGADPGDQTDRAEELLAKWQVVRGQVWVIESASLPGRYHRLLCGDSTNVEDVRRLMRGERAVLFATDPPYLVDYDGTNHPHKWHDPDEVRRRKNKDWSDSHRDWDRSDNPNASGLYDGFVAAAIEAAIAEDAAWYCWHANRNQAMVESVWRKHGAFVHQQIVWVKDRPILTRSWYMWQHEPCFFGWREGHRPKRTAADNPPSVWHAPTVPPGRSTDHPTSKPVELFAIPIRQHTVAGDLCYEPFCGSGSQIVAAEQHRRLCYAIEIEPRYVAATLERLALMGLDPRLDHEATRQA